MSAASVLLVDDRPANLLALEAVLEPLGCVCVRAASGVEALARIDEHEFAVVLLDVQMPEMDGFEVARRISARDGVKPPIIFVTALPYESSYIHRAYEGGGVDFISKPFDPLVLRSKVRVFVELYTARDELRQTSLLLRERERGDLLAREKSARADAEALAAELSSANRLKDEFLATLSHELRTPLNAILGWTRMMRTGAIRQGNGERALETIERNAKVQLQLVEEMLDISRITSGKLTLKTAMVDVVDVVHRAIETVRPAAAAKGVEIHAELDEGSIPAHGDADRLQQVVWNLLSNAVKFTPAGGHVVVEIAATQGMAKIIVKDTGEGIEPEFLPYVFERFRQGDASATRTHGGLGLGLAIVRHLVEAHGGAIRAESEGKGCGSTFVVELPLGQARASLVEAEHTPSWPPPADAMSFAGMRVLVVDDDDDGRTMLATLLEGRDAEVQQARDAREALESIASWRPHLLISDLAMPNVDGCALLAQVRSTPTDAGGSTPAIALSAYTRKEDRRRALLAGFDSYVGKPFEPGELLGLVGNVWRRATRPTPASGAQLRVEGSTR